MGLNPFEYIERLITEHGSAAIQSKHIALLKDQFAILEKKSASLESENATLKKENAKLKSDVQNLRIANNELSAKIQTYEKSTQGNLLDEFKLKILLHLSKQDEDIPESRIGSEIGISHQIALFHTQELSNMNMIQIIHNPFGGPNYLSLTHKGRGYLIDSKLLK